MTSKEKYVKTKVGNGFEEGVSGMERIKENSQKMNLKIRWLIIQKKWK